MLVFKALTPTAVLVDTAPPPLPTVRPEMVASLVTVRFVNAVAPLVKAIVPLEEGNVIVVVPATAGAWSVTAPDVSPETTIELMSFPYSTNQRCPLETVTDCPESIVMGPTDNPLLPVGRV